MNAQFLNWKVTAIVCTLILSGTALFIYDDSKADHLRQRQQAEARQIELIKNSKDLSNQGVYGTATPATAKQLQKVGQNLPGYDIIEPESNVPASPTLKPKPNIFDQFEKVEPSTGTKPWEDFQRARTPSLQLTKPDPILAEVRRANDIAQQKLDFERLNEPSEMDKLIDRHRQDDLIWLQSLQADDLRRIRQIYEDQDLRRQLRQP